MWRHGHAAGHAMAARSGIALCGGAATLIAPASVHSSLRRPRRALSYASARCSTVVPPSAAVPVPAVDAAVTTSTPQSQPQRQHSGLKKVKVKKAAAGAAAQVDAAAAAGVAAVDSKRESYMELRHRELRAAGLCDARTGEFMYPNTFLPTLSLSSFIAQFGSSLAAGERAHDTEVCVAGRLASKRDSSSKLIFYDLVGGRFDEQHAHTFANAAAAAAAAAAAEPLPDAAATDPAAHATHIPKIQILATRAAYTGPVGSAASSSSSSSLAGADPSDDPALHARFKSLHHALKKGDLVWVRGIPAKSKVGELSLVPKDIQLLAPCWHEIPNKLTEPNIRYRQRYLDMLVNRPILSTFALRSRLISALRSFLSSHDFVEVETPILWTSHGGAAAKPFRTTSNALGSDSTPLFLRIAPELFLKQLVIGGMERVFEVSKVFRNEGMDQTHNPEFTTCEFYKAYSSYSDLMGFTEQLLLHLVRASLGPDRTTVAVTNRFTGEATSIDFGATPFRQIDVMSGLKEALGSSADLPDPNDPASLPFYLSECDRLHLSVGLPHTLPRVLDKLIGALLEPQCIAPTFLVHHPECMSPLARRHPTRAGLTERFELFINGAEYANAYSELNDPADQLQRMEGQARAANAGDEEAQPVDAEFCTALEYGLPPTAGWGLGIDRLVMLLAGTTHIRDVLLFPIMKPQHTPSPPHQSNGAQTLTAEETQPQQPAPKA